jgi:hypothetical protein
MTELNPGGPEIPPPSAADVYRSLVAEIIEGRESAEPYPPGAPQLAIVRHHRPRSLDDLASDELVQLHAALQAGPYSVGSEPYLREMFARAATVPPR